ncbi:MAG: LysR family transcriptional regulator [Rhodobacteraceae bacterium]|nr:MAG: LysR family transcriptional regulator [Paracoccaceae bacterium]
MISHRKMEAFRAIVAVGSMSAAAERLNTSQPNLSRLISDLEREVGFVLFRRHSKGLTLTPEGQLFFKEVDRSYRGLAEISLAAQQIRDLQTAQVSLGSISGALVSVVPPATRRWRETHGDLSLRLELQDSDRLVQMTQSGWLDLAIVRAKPQFFDVEVLMQRSVPYVALARAGVTSIDGMDDVDITKLVDPLITPGATFVAARCTDPDVAAAILQKTRIDCYLSLPGINLALQGLGVALVEPIIAGHFAETLGSAVQIRPFRGAPNFDVALITPDGKTLSHACRQFADMLVGQIDQRIAFCAEAAGRASEHPA